MERVLLLLALVFVVSAAPAAARPVVLLATTTSAYDTGLLDALKPLFETRTRYVLKTLAVGSGRALAMGRAGEVDVLLVHAPPAEEEFMRSGAGRSRHPVMHNYFVIVGPSSDPAGVRGAASARDAFGRLFRAGARFFSRGDGSGTNRKELSLLEKSGVDRSRWLEYRETGQGMAATLRSADERRGYTLSDIGTYLALRRHLELVVLFEKDADLVNPYSVIEIDPSAHPRVNTAGARAFATFLQLPSTREFIGRFGIEKFGRALFTPDVLGRANARVEEGSRD